MSREELQTVVKGLFAEDALRERFMSDPEHMLVEFKLDDDEKVALLKLHHRMLASGSLSKEMIEGIDPLQWWI